MKWLWSLMFLCSQVWAFEQIDVNAIFPEVVQGHHGDSDRTCNQVSANQLTQYNRAQINGTRGLPLNFCSIMPDPTNARRCDDGAGGYKICSVTGRDLRGLSLVGDNQFPTITANNNLNCSAGSQTAANAAYGTVTVDNCTLPFPSRSEYRIKTLTARNRATLVLGDGDYFIDRLNIDSVTIRLSGSGTTRIFVNQNVTLFNTVSINDNNQGSLIWVNYRDMVLDNRTSFYGHLYTHGRLSMNNNAAVYGKVTAGSLLMDADATINNTALPPMLTCFRDGFDEPVINPDNWVVSQRNSSALPSIQNGRLRLTQNQINQSTSATFQRQFPGANNYLTVEFDQFAYKTAGSSGADGMAVVLSDATITPQPGAFGGPLGYGFKPGISGFAGGWLGVGIDEYGNYANEGGGGSPGSRPQAVSIRGSGAGTSGYNYVAGTPRNLNPTVDSGTNSNRPHRYRITVDSRVQGRSVALVERDIGAGYSALVGPIDMAAQTGQAAVPNNFLLSLTGSTGSVTNFHEMDGVQICAQRSTPIGLQIDHFELLHSGGALTCNPEEVTIRACANADCSQLITEPVSATLSPDPPANGSWVTVPGMGTVNNGVVTFTGGTAKVLLRNNTVGAVTIGVSGSSSATKPFSTTLCRAGTGPLSTAACSINFADSGFIFDVPDSFANQPQTVAIKAVRKNDVTKQCVPGFANQRKSLKFWSSYLQPNSNPYNSRMTLNSTSLGTSLASATTVPLDFDGQGQATVTINYPDAGQVQLDARYEGTGNEAGLLMMGADQFVARPVGLCLTTTAAQCSANYASCPVFRKAGEPFTLQIQAMAWQSATDSDLCVGNAPTPNFALNNIALGSALVAPTPGSNAVVGTQRYQHVAASNGSTSINQTVNEVGVFQLTATPAANSYFGYTIAPAQSPPVGRFIPADFSLNGGDVVPACGDFTYMDQPFGIRLDVVARNMAGAQTQNYHGAFAKGLGYITAANNQDGHSLSTRLRSLSALPWQMGRAAFTGSSAFVRRADTQQDGPYRSLLFGLYMQDNDGNRTLIANPNFNEAVAGNCSGSSCNARLIDAIPMATYFGRLLAGTAAGQAAAPLKLVLQMQYYEAGSWQWQQQDQCTRLSLSNQGITFLNPNQTFDAASRDLTLGAGRKIKLGLEPVAPGADAAQAKDGEILFQFARPDIAVRIPYRVELARQPDAPLWLSDPTSLQGEAIFGTSRGNDRIIYRREVWQ
ncbi:DUF6701 domain-containing protein [Aeromonas cavernicola]|uniref:MSHA biogenesis protein MshQ n=1 Tax=Aeromonas cavernicola TaxID=1006623 RepID=A0A2H9U298_9GAMM|nr:DUF6701 domain-containing protein [Aeromonas cavernicola]PJG58155.1 MSHA biogenesis protein MshQ [Aeromonas cavernicola]